MIGKIKILGLAFVAITAMSAVTASAAQAGTFDVGIQPAVITGQLEAGQTSVTTLQTTGGGVISNVCTVHSIEGTTQDKFIDNLTTTTTKSGCKFGGLNAVVRMNGCKDTLTGTKTDGQEHPANTFTVDIVGCTSPLIGITIQVAGCQLRIPEQNHLSHVVGTNIKTPGQQLHSVTLQTTTTGITVTQSGLACPDGNGHHSTNLSSTGNMILEAFTDIGTDQITQHGHQFTTHTDGIQVDFTST